MTRIAELLVYSRTKIHRSLEISHSASPRHRSLDPTMRSDSLAYSRRRPRSASAACVSTAAAPASSNDRRAVRVASAVAPERSMRRLGRRCLVGRRLAVVELLLPPPLLLLLRPPPLLPLQRRLPPPPPQSHLDVEIDCVGEVHRRIMKTEAQPQLARPRYHHTVISAQPRRRAHERQAGIGSDMRQLAPDFGVRRDAPRGDDACERRLELACLRRHTSQITRDRARSREITREIT